MPPKEVAEKYGITVKHLHQTAWRKKWNVPGLAARTKALQHVKVAAKKAVSEAVKLAQPAVEEAVRQWTERSKNAAGRAVEHVANSLEQGVVDSDELKTLVGALDVADRVGRRSLGLDKEQSGSSATGTLLHLRLELLGLAGSPLQSGQAIDITHLTESAQEGADAPATPV